jgi:uncharacterized protein YjbJ (UPF0337 family)
MSNEIRNASDEIAGAWKQVRREIRKEWGKLTKDDVEQINGRRAVLAAKIQERYAIAREEANDEIDKWSKGRKF